MKNSIAKKVAIPLMPKSRYKPYAALPCGYCGQDSEWRCCGLCSEWLCENWECIERHIYDHDLARLGGVSVSSIHTPVWLTQIRSAAARSEAKGGEDEIFNC